MDWNKKITLDDEKGVKRFIVAAVLTVWLTYFLPNLLDYIWNITLWKVLQGVNCIIVALPALWAYKKSGKRIRDIFCVGHIKQYIIAFLVALVFLFVFTIIPFFYRIEEMSNYYLIPFSKNWYKIVIFCFFVAPSEEFIYRVYVQETIEGWLNNRKYLAPLISGLIFGMVHYFVGGVFQVCVNIITGITWSYLKYYNKCNYLSVVFGHAIYDTSIFIFNYFAMTFIL